MGRHGSAMGPELRSRHTAKRECDEYHTFPKSGQWDGNPCCVHATPRTGRISVSALPPPPPGAFASTGDPSGLVRRILHNSTLTFSSLGVHRNLQPSLILPLQLVQSCFHKSSNVNALRSPSVRALTERLNTVILLTVTNHFTMSILTKV